MNYDSAKEHIISLLTEGLSEKLYYHGLHHTLDVLNITEELCGLEGVDEYHTLLLKTAALLHDSGFIVNNKNHEEEGCTIARRILPGFGYTEGEVEVICGMIMSTKIPQSPKSFFEEIICDADLDYLGRDDFEKIGNSLFKELEAYGVLSDIREWNKIQVSFLGKHSYFTPTNILRREPEKAKKLANLKELISNY